MTALLSWPVAGQETPRALFPAAPEAVPSEPPLAPSGPTIEVQDLPAPGAWRAGLPGAEADLGGPLWDKGAPPNLAALFSRLPASIGEPTLAALQKALLTAPGPVDDPGNRLLAARVERLLAMGEAATAADLLAGAPEPLSADLASLRVAAQLASGATQPACAAVAGQAEESSPWPEAQMVCAALGRDGTATELALDRLAAIGRPADASLAGLARASVADARFVLRRPLADQPVILPLLRSVPIDVDPTLVRTLSVPERRALAGNPYLAAAARAAAAQPAPAPSVRPELNGTAPADWTAAAAAVPTESRGRWAALADGLGLVVAEPIWENLAGLGPNGEAPDLTYWRGFEAASLAEQRGTTLLFILLLLDGRPEVAAPVTLRRALDGLLALGLEQDARALAAGTGGALGL